MPFQIISGDITRVRADAIVNAANNSFLGGGGVDGAIHAAAGEGLLRECRKLGGCPTGRAKMTGGYDLPAKYVIHTVGPVYSDGKHGEEALLRSCYFESLRLAAEAGCESVAFPLISSGAYGYPPSEALRVATEEIALFLRDSDMLVILVIFDRSSFVLKGGSFDKLIPAIELASEYEKKNIRTSGKKKPGLPKAEFCLRLSEDASEARVESPSALGSAMECCDAAALDFVLDESFSEMLLRKIDEKGLTDAQCYRRANIDRKLFSKIRSDKNYRPSKMTVVAFAVALKLSPEETSEILLKAGFALSKSNYFDLIVSTCIERGEYDIFRINELLFRYDQPLLGC